MNFNIEYAILFGLAGFVSGGYQLRGSQDHAKLTPIWGGVICIAYSAVSYNLNYALLTAIEFAIGLGAAHILLSEVLKKPDAAGNPKANLSNFSKEISSNKVFSNIKFSDQKERTHANQLEGELSSSLGIVRDSMQDELSPLSKKDTAFLVACIEGKATLFDAFWVLGLSISIILLPLIFIINIIFRETFFHTSVVFISIFLVGSASIFRDTAIWRCAGNSRFVGWGLASRAYILFFYCSLFLLFLDSELRSDITRLYSSY